MKRQARVGKTAAKITRQRPSRATGSPLERILALIRKRPGIRPAEINRLLNLEQSDTARSSLLRRGLIRKEKDGSAVRYYPI
jgi:DNA-binding MarR family transcriptional regulator